MKRFAAQYIITGTGEILKQATVTVENDGTIVSVEDFGGSFKETSSTPFYNGIIVPGFVNCHCHLELSGMKGQISKNQGLPEFLLGISEKRGNSLADPVTATKDADTEMYDSGTVACVDICNTPLTFNLKEESKIGYVNMLEVFGVDPSRAERRIQEVLTLQEKAASFKSPSYITPHSLYSMSVPLLSKVSELTAGNMVTSVHFMESTSEKDLLENSGGDMIESYKAMGITSEMLQSRVPDHIQGISELVTKSGNLILVHNTFVEEPEIIEVMKRGKTYWCLCPRSNQYIENAMPPLDLLVKNGADIVIGTDSLASNDSLKIIDELFTLQQAFNGISLAEMIPWATCNGARAMGLSEIIGIIKPGYKPGLVLIENIDLENLKLTPSSSSRRII